MLVLLALLYLGGATLAAWNVIGHTTASTQAIDQILKLHNLQNEASQSLDRFTKTHPLLGTLFSGPVKGALDLPSSEDSAQALHSEVPHLLRKVRLEATEAAWWSWGLLSFSLLYAVAVIAGERSFTTRAVLFALTAISLVCFVIGVLAPAMIIWTAPSIPIDADNLKFVLQHEVRGIGAVIRELFTSGHWVIGGFLFLFSILTPLTKAALTIFVTASRSHALNQKIGEVLHAIGKWSMADVFVAGVLLALFALKSQEATKSIPCLGLYYFIGYCLLSMTTAELLTHSEATDPTRKETGGRLSRRIIGGVVAGGLCFVAGAGLYTEAEYPWAPQKDGLITNLPQEVNDAHLTPPQSQQLQK